MRINFPKLYESASPLVVALSLLYRLAKAGNTAAYDEFKEFFEDEIYDLLDDASTNRGNAFILACDLLSFDDFTKVCDYYVSDVIDGIVDIFDVCPDSFIIEHQDYFKDYYSDEDDLKDCLLGRDFSDDIFEMGANPDEIGFKVPEEDHLLGNIPQCTYYDLAYYAAYYDAKNGSNEALLYFNNLCKDPSQIMYLCNNAHAVIDEMRILLDGSKIIELLKFWYSMKDKEPFFKSISNQNEGALLYNAFMEDSFGKDFYERNKNELETAGMKPEA